MDKRMAFIFLFSRCMHQTGLGLICCALEPLQMWFVTCSHCNHSSHRNTEYNPYPCIHIHRHELHLQSRPQILSKSL